MGGIVSLLKVVVSLGMLIAQYVHDKQLMEAGAAKAILEGLKDVDNKIAVGRTALRDVDQLPVESDEANRANKH